MSEGDENQLIAQRRAKLDARRTAGNPFPNDFRRTHFTTELQQQFGERDKDALEALAAPVAVAGRLMAKRVQGKVSFARLSDMRGAIQLFLQRETLGEEAYRAFKNLDVGDIVGVRGTVYRTNRGELSVDVRELCLLTKSLRPLPEKWHGLADQEQRYRQRYVDLLMNEPVREVFRRRSAIVDGIRRFMLRHDFLEVETPMMQPIPGGAAARPFVTHHNALDMRLYLRIAPELYLKRLLVGGFERVFEINRNFRNEGLSTRHNPEFTMLEFYQAYADYDDFMTLTEAMLREVAQGVLGTTSFDYGGQRIDVGAPFRRVSLREAIVEHNPGASAEILDSEEGTRALARDLGVELKPGYGHGRVALEIFEASVEARLIQPTFVTGYPAEVSPLSRRSDTDPNVVDRFELFIAGREIANGFSELNDPEDQAERFRQQVAEKDAGDEEAMHFDADYVRALEYGMPPAAGTGIGIDRLVMLLTDSGSIRDVLLFPHLRPES